VKDKYPQITKEELVRLKEEGYTNAQMCRYFNAPEQSVSWRLKKYHIKLDHKFISITEKIKKQIIQEYNNGLTIQMVADKLNVSFGVCSGVLKTSKITRSSRDHIYNRKLRPDYFSKIDNEEKAYFLGFLYADGCIKDNGGVTLSLHNDDAYMVKKFAAAIYIEPESLKYDLHCSRQTRITVSNKKIHKDLINLGLIPRKSLTIRFPTQQQVPDSLLRHFIRGVFDGDGCACFKTSSDRDTYHFFSNIASGSRDFILSLKEVLEKYELTPNFGERIPKGYNPIYSLSFTRNASNKKFFEFLYKDVTIFLTRKKAKFDQFIKSVL